MDEDFRLGFGGDGLPPGVTWEKMGYDGAFFFKADITDEGKVLAKVASTDVVDEHLHIIDPGAVDSIQYVDISDWGHSSLLSPFFMPRQPVGDGKLWSDVDKKALMLDMVIDLESDGGGQMFRRQKRKRAAKAPSYWSIGWRNLAPPVREERIYQGRKVTAYRLMKIEVAETSPVLRGASPRTRTLAVKAGEPSEEREFALAPLLAKDAAYQEARSEIMAGWHRYFRDHVLRSASL